jgi:general secretion pathway protein D
MAPIKAFRTLAKLGFLATIILANGCAHYNAERAFEQAEQFAAEEQYDKAVEKYFEATQEEPGSKTYKLKLIASRTQASAYHIRRARQFSRDKEYKKALSEYRLARGFDPSLEIAAQEEKQILNLLEARRLVEEAQNYYRQRRLSYVQKFLKKALELDPNNSEAHDMMALLQREQQTISMDGVELDVASSDPITLHFKDANIKEVFGILNQLTGINFIMDEDVRDQAITVLLEKATFAQAMELILQMNGLGKKVLNSKTMIIYPETKDKEKQYEDQVIQTFYLSHIDAKKAVNMLRTMLQLRKIYVHEERNAIVIRDKPEVIRLAEQIIDAADRENSEVIYNMEIVTVSSLDELDIGPELSPYSVSLGFANDDGDRIVSGGLESGTDTSNLVSSLSGLEAYYTVPTATFEFAKTLTNSEILASPKIRVRNKEKAKVHIGTREPVITVTTTGETSTDSIQYVDVGVKVDVEPSIQLDKTVQTKLRLEVSRKIDEVETTNGSVALTIQTTNAETVLTLKDGVQTILGGLFEQETADQRSSIPFLGDIPILGNLVSNNKDRDLKREILLSITPYIIRQVEVPEIDVATIWSGGEDNLKAGPNFGAFAAPLVSEIEATRPVAAPSLSKKFERKSEFDVEVKADVRTQALASSATMPPEIQGVDEEAKIQDEGEIDTQIEAVIDAEPSAVEEVVSEEVVSEEVVSEEVVSEEVVSEEVVSEEVVSEEVVSEEVVSEEVVSEEVEVSEEPMLAEPIPKELPDSTIVEAPTQLELPKSGPARLSFSGPKTVNQGQEFLLTVEVIDIERLYSAPLFVSYDPASLEFVSVNEGVFLKQEGQPTVFSSSPNRTTGKLIVGYKQGAAGAGASGSGALFTLRFKPKKVGQTGIELTRINFRDPDGTRLNVEPAKVTVEVR